MSDVPVPGWQPDPPFSAENPLGKMQWPVPDWQADEAMSPELVAELTALAHGDPAALRRLLMGRRGPNPTAGRQ